jgi:hypothetical protein
MFARLLIAGTLASLVWGQALEEGKRAFDAQKYAAAERLFEKAHHEVGCFAKFSSTSVWRDTASR